MSSSVIRRRPFRLALLGLALSVPAISGCQSWWNRSNSQSLLGFTNEGQNQKSDDWEHPSAPSERDTKTAPVYQLPASKARSLSKSERPTRVTLPRDRQKESQQTASANADLAATPTPKTATPEPRTQENASPADLQTSAAKLSTVATAAPVTQQVPQAQASQAEALKPASEQQAETKPVEVAQASALSPVASSPNVVMDSGQSEVDVEGALALLPAQYQSSLRKKIAGESDVQNQSADKSAAEHMLNKAVESDPKDPTRWTGELNQSVVALEKLLEASTDMEPSIRMHHEMTLRLLYLAQRNLEMAKRPIPEATPREQEYLEHQLAALFHATSPDPNPSRPRHWSQVASEQKIADRHLAALSNLQVSPPVFCTQVDGYGLIHKFERNAFSPDQQVLLYCELENVTSEKVREGFETKVRGTYEIRDAQGKRVLEQALPMEPDVCSNQRRDFFLVYMIYMPPNIDAGKYELILTMEDLCGNKFGSSKTEFEVKN